jgi:endonuclease/exonuclease/phosphatase family metal-dependent hydrolase
MNLHIGLIGKIANSFSSGRPNILIGDFNTKPTDIGYRFLTEGKLDQQIKELEDLPS